MKTFSSEELAILTNALEKSLDYVHRTEALTEQVSDLPDLLMPGDGHRLFTLGEWTAHQILSPKLSNGWRTSKAVKRTPRPGAS